MMIRAADLSLKFALIITCILFSGAAQAIDLAKKQTIVITGPELCPYNCATRFDAKTQEKNYEVSLSGLAAVDPYGKTQLAGYGYVVDIVKEIYEPLGYNVVYRIAEQNTGLQRIKSGRYEILIDATPNRKANKDVFYSKQAIGQTQGAFFTTSDFDWSFAGVEYLQNVTLGLNKNHIYPELEDYASVNKTSSLKIQLTAGPNATRQNIEQLLRGKINVYFADRNLVEYTVFIMQLQSQIREAGTFSVKKAQPLFLGFSANNKHTKKYAKIFDVEIKKLRKSGKLAEIMAKYGLKDWQKNSGAKHEI